MKRRDLILSAAAALPAAPAFAAPAFARPGDPHPTWLVEWRRQRAAWLSALDQSEDETPESEAAYGVAARLGELIAKTPATTREGLSAQLEWVLDDGRHGFCCPIHKDAVTRVYKALVGEGIPPVATAHSVP